MRLNELELTNFGQHEHLHLKDLGAIVALLGTNGSGKSTVMTAVAFLWHGELPKAQEHYVRYYGMEGGASNAIVRGVFTHLGRRGEITRQIGKTPKREFKWEDEKPITSAAGISKLLQEILLVDKAALSEAVFIPQGATDSLIHGTAAVRQDLYSKIMLVSYLQTRTNELDKKKATLLKGVKDYTVALDEAKSREHQASLEVQEQKVLLQGLRDTKNDVELLLNFVEAHKNLRDSELSLREEQLRLASITEHGELLWQDTPALVKAGFGAVGPFSEAEDSHAREALRRVEQEVAKFSQTEASLQLAEDRRQRKAELQAEIGALQTSLMKLSLKLDRLPTLEDMLEQRESFRNIEAAHSKCAADVTAAAGEEQNLARRQEALEAALQNQQKRETKLQEAEKDWDGTGDSLEQEMLALQPRLNLIKEVLNHSSEDHVTNCPTCEQRLQQPELFTRENLEEQQKAFNLLTRHLKEKRDAVKEASTLLMIAKSQVVKAQQECDESQRRLEVVQNRMAAQGELLPLPDETEVAELNEKIETYKVLSNEQRSFSRQLQEKTEQLAAVPEGPMIYGNLKDVRDKLAHFRELEQTTIHWVGRLIPVMQDRNKVVYNITALSARVCAEETRLDQRQALLTEMHPSAQKQLATVIGDDDPGAFELKAHEDVVGAMIAKWVEQGESFYETCGRLKQAHANLDVAIRGRREIETRRQMDENVRTIADELDTLKKAFSREGVPMAYLSHRFDLLVDETVRQLTVLGSNFTVRADKDTPMNFQFRRIDKPEEYWMDQSQLSGGQSVRLTLAFLLAVQKQVLSNIGFLSLDEPCQGLDTDGVESLRDLFMRLENHLNSNEAQLWVCDHRVELIPALSSVFRLGEESPL